LDRGKGEPREPPTRGPLLIISGEKDHVSSRAIAHASYKKQQRNQGVTEIVDVPNRGHALVVDSGWREVAEAALAFVQRFGSPDGTTHADSHAAAHRHNR
jgi:pimeloyl-ACP methyl ester carboxylesterase